ERRRPHRRRAERDPGSGRCGRALVRADRGTGRLLARRQGRDRARRGDGPRPRGERRVSEREYDVVLFGATGFTGALTAQYLARAVAAPGAPATRWALAGRNRGKLEAVRSGLAEIDPAAAKLALLEADINDSAAIRAVAEPARVVISTVGPYIFYGEPLVAACAAAGTDYVDLTGEPEFVDRMWLGDPDQGRRRRAGAGGWCPPAALIRPPTTSARCSRSGSCPRGSRSGSPATCGPVGRSPAGPITRRSTSWAVCVRARSSPASARGARRSRRHARSGGSPASRIARPWPAAGCSHSPPSTRRPCCAPRGRSIATGRISP